MPLLPDSSRIPATCREGDPVDTGMEGALPEEIPFLRAFLRRLVVSHPHLEIDDLQQQTMDRALRFQHRYDPARPLRPWLQSIGFRVFLDAREAASRAPQPLPEREQAAAMPTAASWARQEVQNLPNALPEPIGAILQRFYLQEQSVAEIAEALQLPTGTVKSHLHRGRKLLAQEQAKEMWL